MYCLPNHPRHNIAWNLLLQLQSKAQKAHATFLGSYGKINRRRRLIRAKEAEGRVWLPSDIHHSSVISNMTECNCFIDLEAGRRPVEGEDVRIIYIKGMQF